MRFFLVLTIASALTLASHAQTSQEPRRDTGVAGDADKGKKLYAQYGCYQCHGYAAQGGTGPRLAPRPSSFASFSKYIRQPSGEMPPYTAKVLSDAQVRDIYSFLESIPPPPQVDNIPLLKEN
jgi:mono/diheme cytochrome c family protein